MNTDALAKRYRFLTPAERLPLIVAASGRGDEVERRRLVESAPQIRTQMADFSPLAKAHQRTEETLSASSWI